LEKKLMNAFARTIDCGSMPSGLRQRRGVIKVQELQQVREAAGIVDNAQRQAEKIIANAKRRGKTMVEKEKQATQAERESVLSSAERAFWAKAAEQQRALDAEFRNSLAVLEEHTQAVVSKALTKLAGEIPPEARVRACVKALFEEAGQELDGTLLVNEQDYAALQESMPALPWTLQADSGVPVGSCRLVSRRGEWRSEFDGRLESLLAVFASRAIGAVRDDDDTTAGAGTDAVLAEFLGEEA
jgi:flagellar biosynthesis/type III secretory pathway protein FliH